MQEIRLPSPRDVLSRFAVFLDFDGTLVDIAAEPRLVVVPDGLGQDLATLADRLGGALAIISGRTIGEIDTFLSPLRLPTAGEHGMAVRPTGAGDVLRGAMPAVPDDWRDAAAAWAGAIPGVIAEQKPAGLVLHYRQAPEAGPHLVTLLQALVADVPAFEVIEASAAWEIRPRGTDKGTALAALMRGARFAGRQPLFIGDDVTDEDGIAVALALGGVGLRVAPTFGDAAGVRRWLADLAVAA